ncbi:MAG: FAD-dependent monooxygenase [Gemmatimonadota bacterium]
MIATIPGISGAPATTARRAQREQVDTLIVGAGPAGAATAIALAQHGRTTVLVDRNPEIPNRLGEALPPAILVPLARLGVGDHFRDESHFASTGTRSIWGSGVDTDSEFLFRPHGAGWHVCRDQFDTMLVARATSIGTRLHLGTRITGMCWTSAGWEVEVESERGESVSYLARYLVDATGRASAAARRLGVCRVAVDRLVGVSAIIDISGSSRNPGHDLLVEATESGWWYSAPLRGDQMVVTYLSDADLYPGDRRSIEGWRNLLMLAPHTERRVGGSPLVGGLRVGSARTSRLAAIAGRDWLAVGESAMALDPLSSAGVHRALTDGLEGAEAIEQHLSGDVGAPIQHARASHALFEQYLQLRRMYYRHERRWAESPFWRRRAMEGMPVIRRPAGRKCFAARIVASGAVA